MVGDVFKVNIQVVVRHSDPKECDLCERVGIKHCTTRIVFVGHMDKKIVGFSLYIITNWERF